MKNEDGNKIAGSWKKVKREVTDETVTEDTYLNNTIFFTFT